MITGKVITNTTAYKKLQKKNKEQEARIKNLMIRHNKWQPRQQIKESVCYLHSYNTIFRKRKKVYSWKSK